MSRQIDIQLFYSFLYHWQQEGNTAVISNTDTAGLFDFLGQEYLEFDRLLQNFAMVIHEEHFIMAVVDRVRSFPLFYKITNDALRITDNIAAFENEFTFDENAAEFFMSHFCTEGPSTLLRDWKQLQPGEFLYYDKNEDAADIQKYASFGQLDQQEINAPEIKIIYKAIFDTIVAEAGDRPLIVPLSGGYDSRCIAAGLKMSGAKNIFAYTYGRNDSPEKAIAEKVAGQLQLDWKFVEYDDKLLDVFFAEKWQAYSDKNHHFTSLPHEQDFFALYALQQKGLLPANGIVLPGFFGDYYAGSMFKDGQQHESPGKFQHFYMADRGCKFILNAVRVYEYFGLEWRVPLAHPGLIDAWLSVSLEERLYKNGYNNFLSEEFFNPLQIDFRKADHDYDPRRFKNFIKSVLPENLVKKVQAGNARSNVNDPNNTAYLYDGLVKREGETIKNVKFDFNEAHARYFLKQLAGKIVTFRR